MTKYILVGGYIHKAKDGGKAFCDELVKGFNIGKPVIILDCMFGRSKDSWENYLKEDNELFSKYINNFKLELALPENFTEQVKKSDIIFLRGGYVSTLFEILNKDNSWINELDGKVLAGTSAGAEVIAKYYHVLSTHRTGDGFGILPIKFIPHWKSESFEDNKQDINYEKVINDLTNYKEDLPILTLSEGEFKVYNK